MNLRRLKTYTVITFLCFFITINQSFSENLGSWNIFNVRGNLFDNFGFMSEFQLRSLSFYDEFFYYELKGGINYALSENFTLLLGTGFYHTFPPGGNFVTPSSQRELRTWIELTTKQYLDRFNFEHRYRIEQRFTSNGYKNRYRYRLLLVVPINSEKLKDNTLYSAIFEEVFFTNLPPYFERNRIFAGLGYKLDFLTLQVGYIYQYDYRITNPKGHSYLQASFVFDVSSKDKTEMKTLPMHD
ncbi:MAG: DUF2490 domain-containing protein [Candidatus Kapabacteria bacterium]|nr:DUF2490 domain-containing protein [Candidatus Kapabacteria bacterium]